MKITKSELHKIIKEELDSISEGLAPGWMAGIFTPGPKKSKKQKPDEETVAKNKKAKKSSIANRIKISDSLENI